MDEKDNKNLKSDDSRTEQKIEQDPPKGEYSFMKEVIKRKPVDKKKIAIRIGCIIGAAALFGAVSAVVFAKVLPIAQDHYIGKEKPPKVDITSEDDAKPSEDPLAAEQDMENEDEQQISETETAEPDPPKELNLEDYKKLYAQMLNVASEPKKSIVTVIGITSEVDWFNQTYENPSQLSGLIVANNGQDLFILTEYRIVDNVDRIQVKFLDGNTVDARFQKADKNTGLTILKVPLTDIPQDSLDKIIVAPLGSSYGIRQGEPVIAIGSPMGYSDSVAYGVVTSVTNKISVFDTEYNLLTTDILGSSNGSGILLNLHGEVVGIIAQSYSVEDNKSIVTGLAISQMKELIETLSNNTEILFVGIKGLDVTTDIATKTGIPKGIWVNSVAEDSPAMQVGIQPGNVIVGINSEPVETIQQYHEQLSKHKAGEIIKLKAMRQGAEGYVEVVFEVTAAAS